MIYAAFIAAVVTAMLLTLFTLGLGAAASKPRPKPDPWTYYFLGAELPISRPDLDAQVRVVEAAEEIVRKAAAS